MSRRTLIAAAAGSVLGSFSGLLTLALAAGVTLDGSLGLADGDPAFVVQQGSLYLFIVVAGTVAGALIAMVGYGVGTQSAPDEDRYGMGPLAALGAVTGAIAAFAASRAAIGLAGDIVDKMVILPLFPATIVALVSGAATGLLVTVTVERLSRPEALGLEGAAWPASFGTFLRDATAAVGWPTVGIAVGAGLVYVLSEVLLESETLVALIIFGGVAAAFLFGAAIIAANPPRRDS